MILVVQIVMIGGCILEQLSWHWLHWLGARFMDVRDVLNVMIGFFLLTPSGVFRRSRPMLYQRLHLRDGPYNLPRSAYEFDAAFCEWLSIPTSVHLLTCTPFTVHHRVILVCSISKHRLPGQTRELASCCAFPIRPLWSRHPCLVLSPRVCSMALHSRPRNRGQEDLAKSQRQGRGI